MKFGQLIECNIKNFFLEKSFTNQSGGEFSPRHFPGKIKSGISLDQ